jgi:hypothetical protein
VQPYVPQPVHDPPLPGMIFGCTTDTYQECMARQLFGLPERNRNQVRDHCRKRLSCGCTLQRNLVSTF